jgi:acetyltransferase
MGVYNLDKIFKPESIAVIGASEKKDSIGSILVQNLVQGAFQGKIYPVNPKYRTLHALKAYPSILEVDSPVDLAIIATPIATVPEIVTQCVAKNVGGAIIISAGGKEVGAQGEEIEKKIVWEAWKGGLRIIGPNYLGIICPERNLNASFVSRIPQKGKLAFISQSGAICSAILDLSPKAKIGFSHFVSIGSMVDVDFGDLIDYLAADPQVSSILLYMEGLSNFRKFMSAARAASRVKPVVVLKSGRSPAGTRAAASHTGAMAGEDAVYDAAFKRAGIVRVNTIGELFDCAELMAKQPRPSGSRLAIVTNAGGPGVMAADALSYYGLEPTPLQADTLEKLDSVLPAAWSHANPIDILGDASPDKYTEVVKICIGAQELDGVLVVLTPQAMTDPTAVAKGLARISKSRRYPLFASWMGGVDVEKGAEILNLAEIPTYGTPEQAIKAFMYMHEYSRNLEMLQQIPPKLSKTLKFDRNRAQDIIRQGSEREKSTLTELQSKEVLAAYGLPVNRTEIATSAEEAVQLARDMGFPLAMKILSPEIVHKTEANGIKLDLRTENEVFEAFRALTAKAREYDPEANILGVTLQPMIMQSDYEILLGAKMDPNFGPVILFGMGGIFTEVVKDRNIGLPPLNLSLARQIMEGTRVYTLLKGYRKRPPANIQHLEEIILRLSQLVIDFPEIVELDMNPVIVSKGEFVAVDARIVLEPAVRLSPLHLVISPYPEQYESRELTPSGLPIMIRPIKPEDAPLLVELFDTLSPTSIYYRFFGPLKALPHSMLVLFTQVDYDREIDLIALEQAEDGKERMVATARVMSDPDGKRAEFAILVGDPWQGKGVGAILLERCLAIAKERGLETVWGMVLQENTGMQALARKLGFEVSRSGEPGELELTIDLKSVDF